MVQIQVGKGIRIQSNSLKVVDVEKVAGIRFSVLTNLIVIISWAHLFPIRSNEGAIQNFKGTFIDLSIVVEGSFQ